MPEKIKLGEIVNQPEKGSFQIKRGSESNFWDYDPSREKENWLWKGDVLKVPSEVTLKVRPEHDRILEWEVKDVPYWVVSHFCHPAPDSKEVPVQRICPKPSPSARSGEIISERIRIRYFDSDGGKSQQQTPAKLGEISEYPIGKKFKIKRHAWADFKDYHSSTWGLGLYEGDQLKVPPGVTVKVRFENNNEVQVSDNNQPWDAIENWQNL